MSPRVLNSNFRISLKRKSHREDGPPGARDMICNTERILWAEIASHSRMRDVCGDLHPGRKISWDIRPSRMYVRMLESRHILILLLRISASSAISAFEKIPGIHICRLSRQLYINLLITLEENMLALFPNRDRKR